MATAPRQRRIREIDYPTGDGKPMAETDVHRDDMIDLIQALRDHFARDRMVYVSGNLLMYYQEGDRRKHVSPDVFVVRGVKNHRRDHYLVWQETKGPDVVFEITSKSTKREDKGKKWELYRDVLGVSEYFLFDPTEDYLKPSLEGHRLVGGDYGPIPPVAGRLPSQVLGLHLERDGEELRLFNPATATWLPTRKERARAAEQRAEEEHRRAEEQRRRAEAAEADRRRLAIETDRLRQEIQALRGDPEAR